jgi:hypothetical protein
MDMEEMVSKLRRGEPLYGVSTMDPYYQQVGASQSRYAQLKFRIFPFIPFASPFPPYLLDWSSSSHSLVLVAGVIEQCTDSGQKSFHFSILPIIIITG